jgi:hypothetical protein
MNLELRDIIYENYGLKCHINEFTIKIMVIPFNHNISIVFNQYAHGGIEIKRISDLKCDMYMAKYSELRHTLYFQPK